MLSNRVGTFLILLGFLLVGLYILSDISQAPVCNFFLFGILSLGVGLVLWFRNPAPPPQPSGRFRIIRGMGKKQNKGKK